MTQVHEAVVGIQHTKKILSDLGDVALAAVGIVKAHGSIIGSISKLYEVLKNVKDIIAEAPQALPELKDIDSAEAGEIASLTYGLVRSLVVAIAA